ncbi:trigger factor [Wolffia australiana]
MEDAITEIPPPSRFFPEDLDNFAARSPPAPLPFLLFSGGRNPNSGDRLLVVAISAASRQLLHRISPKQLAGSLFLPDLSIAGNRLDHSPHDSGCRIFAAGENALLAAFQYPARPDTARQAAKALIEGVSPEEVIVLDAVRSGAYRGRLSGDCDFLEFKLETSARRAAGSLPALRHSPYYPTGSVVDGVAAALLAECQMRGLKGTLFLTWPDDGSSSSSLESLLQLLPGSVVRKENGKLVARKNGPESDLYV